MHAWAECVVYPRVGPKFIYVTGLIYVAIVALWAAVLIPMWLRRHDADEAHRLERHAEAMGTLARFRSGRIGAGSPTQRAARRRRTILATLIALTAFGGTAWWLEMVGVWALIAPAVVLGAFLLGALWASQTSRAATAREASRSERRVAVRQVRDLDFDEEFIEEARPEPVRPRPTPQTARQVTRRELQELDDWIEDDNYDELSEAELARAAQRAAERAARRAS
jgi:hypothetical protein